MTTEDRQSIRCHCCGHLSEHWVLTSTNSFGLVDLDQREPGMARHTMEMWLQECPSCGYVAPSLDRGDEADCAFASTPAYQMLRSQLPSSSERRFLLRAALVASKGDAEDAFSEALCAAWTADDESRTDRARELRVIAAGYVAGQRWISLDTRLRLLDVLRRSSRWEDANTLAKQLRSEKLEHPFCAIVDFHLGRIAAHDDGCYTISRALNPSETDEALDI